MFEISYASHARVERSLEWIKNFQTIMQLQFFFTLILTMPIQATRCSDLLIKQALRQTIGVVPLKL